MLAEIVFHHTGTQIKVPTCYSHRIQHNVPSQLDLGKGEWYTNPEIQMKKLAQKEDKSA